jgi:hypothetical protein
MTDHTAPQLSDGELWELIHKDFPFACDRWEPLLNFDQIKTVIRRALAAAPGTAEAQPATPQEAPPADGGAQKEWRIQQLAKLLQSALRIPAMPFPDPGAHSWQAYAQAVHAAYCAVRFKVINAIADLEKIAQPAQPAVDAARPAAQALSDEQIAVRGRFDVAVALLRECLGPLEVSAAIIESDDGEPMEALIRRVKTFVSAASAPEEPAEPVPAQPKRSDPKNCTARVNCDNGIITTRSCTTQRPLIDKGGSSDGERDYYECPDCGKSITIDYREN